MRSGIRIVLARLVLIFIIFFHEQYDALMGPATRRALSGEDAEGASAGLKAAGAVVRASRRPMQKAVALDT